MKDIVEHARGFGLDIDDLRTEFLEAGDEYIETARGRLDKGFFTEDTEIEEIEETVGELSVDTFMSRWSGFGEIGSRQDAIDRFHRDALAYVEEMVSDEYPVGRFFRNCKAAVIYEGTREIHKLMQADYALGIRQDKPRRVDLPPFSR